MERKASVMELTGADGLSQTAMIKMTSGEVKTVQYKDLRPLAVGRPSRRIPDVQAEVGEFIMWMDEDGEWIGGVVRAVEGSKLQVHLMEGSASGFIWRGCVSGRMEMQHIDLIRWYQVTGNDGQCRLGAGFWNFDENEQIE